MIVSMIQIILELPDISSIKEKRKYVVSLKKRLEHKFRVSAAEVDLLDSLSFTQIGAAIVSNSKIFGESVLNKVLLFVENEFHLRIQDVQIYSEQF
ncbi:MAG: DUF503 domain-containing protein [Spirochaetales bacterium]|nr:MAG: DUF503 domain-containing protein [Spirochaetales bacterium]